MSSNNSSISAFSSLGALVLSGVAFLYHFQRQFLTVSNSTDTHPGFLTRIKNSTLNTRLSLLGLFVTLWYFLFIFISESGASDLTQCTVVILASDIGVLLRNILLILYYGLRLTLVSLKKRAIWIKICIGIVVVLQILTFVYLATQRSILYSTLDPLQPCISDYQINAGLALAPYLAAVTLPILVCNVIFTVLLIRTIRALPNNTSSLQYLSKSSRRVDLINVIITFCAIFAAAAGSNNLLLNNLSILLYSAVFHFALMVVSTKSGTARTGGSVNSASRAGTVSGRRVSAAQSKLTSKTPSIAETGSIQE